MLAVGAIMYVATHTRPDLAYAASLLNRFVANQALQHVIRYIGDISNTEFAILMSHTTYRHTDSEHDDGGIVHKEGRRSTSSRT
jgi:hypothetical protein